VIDSRLSTRISCTSTCSAALRVATVTVIVEQLGDVDPQCFQVDVANGRGWARRRSLPIGLEEAAGCRNVEVREGVAGRS